MSARPTILVVEDEAITAMALKAALTEMGYHVPFTAPTGEEAIARARELKPDAVLMDIRLKGPMDGITAADTIRRELGSPVIYLTAYSDPETLRRARVTEPYGYIVKPYNEKELRAIVEIAVHKGAMERARRASSEEVGAQVLQGIIDANPAPIYLTHADGRLMLVNRRFEERYGLRRGALADAKLPRELAEADARALAAGAVADARDAVRLPLQRADGTTYGLCTILAETTSAAGAMSQLRDQLEQRAPPARGELRGAAAALANGHADISAEARALGGSVRKLLGGLFNAGRPATKHATTVDVSALAREAGATLAAGKADVAVEDGLRAHGDPLLLKLVMENLLRNALAFPPAQGRLRIDVGRAPSIPGEVVVFVRDNGAGFDPKDEERVFEPFARGQGEQGLALSAVRNLVEGHGGRVWAEGRPGAGATFYVSLPEA